MVCCVADAIFDADKGLLVLIGSYLSRSTVEKSVLYLVLSRRRGSWDREAKRIGRYWTHDTLNMRIMH